MPAAYTIYCQKFSTHRGLTQREGKKIISCALTVQQCFLVISGLMIKVQLNHKPTETMERQRKVPLSTVGTTETLVQ